jgi:hypothetical protein
MRVVVATHGHCFDELASAVVFTRLFRSVRGNASFSYRACDYGVGDSAVPAAWLDGDENAILDYRYTDLEKLTWWFDHHATAFQSPSDRARFDAGHPAERHYEPTYGSCTKLIADVARETFGVAMPELDELVRWADVIDTAGFASPSDAVERREPALRLMTVIEHHGDDRLLAMLVPRLASEPLADVAASSEVTALLAPLAVKRAAAMAHLRVRAEQRGPVAFADLTDAVTDAVEKFGMYQLFPRATYSVVVAKTASKVKISIGYNPWSGAARTHHVGELCRRHGGGGHPVVGSIALATSEVERGRTLAAELAEELSG